MTADAVLGVGSVNEFIRRLIRARMTEFIGHIALRVTVPAGQPGVVNAMIRVRKMQGPVTLPTKDAHASDRNALSRLRVEKR